MLWSLCTNNYCNGFSEKHLIPWLGALREHSLNMDLLGEGGGHKQFIVEKGACEIFYISPQHPHPVFTECSLMPRVWNSIIDRILCHLFFHREDLVSVGETAIQEIEQVLGKYHINHCYNYCILSLLIQPFWPVCAASTNVMGKHGWKEHEVN